MLPRISFSLYIFLRILTNIVQNFFGKHQACFCSVVVLTCASHAQGPQFDPEQKHSKLINFRLYCRDRHVYLIRVRSLKIVLLSHKKVCFQEIFILISCTYPERSSKIFCFLRCWNSWKVHVSVVYRSSSVVNEQKDSSWILGRNIPN